MKKYAFTLLSIFFLISCASNEKKLTETSCPELFISKEHKDYYSADKDNISGKMNYILAPNQIKIGDEIVSGRNKEIKIGNCMPLCDIPDGTDIHNIELSPNGGGKLARSAGASAKISGTDENYCMIKLASGEIRKVINMARATIGSVSNNDHQNIKIGKAGRNRWKGWRPSVRGVAMNPVDHPHGGGEGKTSGGRSPVSP